MFPPQRNDSKVGVLFFIERRHFDWHQDFSLQQLYKFSHFLSAELINRRTLNFSLLCEFACLWWRYRHGCFLFLWLLFFPPLPFFLRLIFWPPLFNRFLLLQDLLIVDTVIQGEAFFVVLLDVMLEYLWRDKSQLLKSIFKLLYS